MLRFWLGKILDCHRIWLIEPAAILASMVLLVFVCGCTDTYRLNGSYQGTVAPTVLYDQQGQAYPAVQFIPTPGQKVTYLPSRPLILADQKGRILLLPAISPGDVICATGQSANDSVADLSGQTILMGPLPGPMRFLQSVFFTKRLRLLRKGGAAAATAPVLEGGR